MWVELHALEGIPLVCNNPINIFSTGIKAVADANQCIVISPWGRQLGSFYMDGVAKTSGTNKEPEITDDMSTLAGWNTYGGSWSATGGGTVKQSDSSPSWKEAVRTGSYGQDDTVRVRYRELSRSGTSAVGINLRRDPVTGDCYHIDLCNQETTNGTVKYVRVFKYEGGTWKMIRCADYPFESLSWLNPWTDVKASSYAGYLRVFVNDRPVNIQGWDNAPYGTGIDVPEAPTAGEASITSFGGVHEFDEFRVGNDWAHGETDVTDCIYQAMEKLNVDPNRVYASGLSMGGTGAYTLAVANPGLFTAVSPNAGSSDMVYNYEFLKENYPVGWGDPYADVNDARVCDIWRLLNGMEHDTSAASIDTPRMRDYSARYVLENLANTDMRIVHGSTDSCFPNNYNDLEVMWWTIDPASGWWMHVDAPAPYCPATATFANGADIYAALNGWSATGPYYCEYNTSPYGGHGFMESYSTTGEFFKASVLERNPAAVACKTYGSDVFSSYWMTMKRYAAAGDQAGLARAEVDTAANRVSVHARNAEQLTLDLDAAGVTAGAGQTVTLTLDAATDPSLMPVTDTLGSTSLRLLHDWPVGPGSAIAVSLDGAVLVKGTGYTWDGAALVVPSITLGGSGTARTLTVTMPAATPANLLANPGFETADAWATNLASGSASFERSTTESHTGGCSARVKNPGPFNSPYVTSWDQAVTTGITGGKSYRFNASYRTRMLHGAAVRAELEWYNSAGTLLATASTPAETLGTSGYSTHGWYTVSMETAAPAGAARCRVRLETVGTGGQATGSVFFDDAALYALP